MKYLLLFLLLPVSGKASEVTTEDFWIRLTPPMRKMTAAFGKINNKSGKEIKLMAASSPIASKIEIHTHEHQNGVMKMRKVDSLNISKNGSLVLKPKGHHLMFFGLKRPLKDQEAHTIELKFNNGKSLSVKAKVK